MLIRISHIDLCPRCLLTEDDRLLMHTQDDASQLITRRLDMRVGPEANRSRLLILYRSTSKDKLFFCILDG